MPFDQDQFRAIVSGRRNDTWARIVRLALRAASVGYHLVVRVRNILYDRHMLGSHQANVPILCVGNLTTGGTGKTPLVAWLARLMVEKGLRTAILTRGYKSEPGASSDEPAELASACPGVPVIVNPNRVAGAAEAIRSHGVRALLMDDGFQHRRLARDLDIITIDATVPFGYDRLLPAGLLREPIGSLKRAHAVVLTRTNQVSEEDLGRIEAKICRIRPDLMIARSVHAPVRANRSDGTAIPLEELKGKRVFAFCGLGNPAAFFATLRACECLLVGSRAYNDHYAYTDRDLTDLRRAARGHKADLLVTTQKDATKIARMDRSQGVDSLVYLTIELCFTAGEDPLRTLIERALGGKMLCS
jgi:tetraacyldisaccharide 4'-kinase